MEWSPNGGMLATVHRQGVALWGGQSFGRLMRVGHPGVQRLLFSPCERYMLTFSEFPDNRGRPHVRPACTAPARPHALRPSPALQEQPVQRPLGPQPVGRCPGRRARAQAAVTCGAMHLRPARAFPAPFSPQFVAHVWEVRTGKRLRTFDGPHDEYAVGALQRPDRGMRWPAFRWSGGVGGAPALLAHMKKNAVRWGQGAAGTRAGDGNQGGATGVSPFGPLSLKRKQRSGEQRGAVTEGRRDNDQCVRTAHAEPSCWWLSMVWRRIVGCGGMHAAPSFRFRPCTPSAACTKRRRWSCSTRRV